MIFELRKKIAFFWVKMDKEWEVRTPFFSCVQFHVHHVQSLIFIHFAISHKLFSKCMCFVSLFRFYFILYFFSLFCIIQSIVMMIRYAVCTIALDTSWWSKKYKTLVHGFAVVLLMPWLLFILSEMICWSNDQINFSQFELNLDKHSARHTTFFLLTMIPTQIFPVLYTDHTHEWIDGTFWTIYLFFSLFISFFFLLNGKKVYAEKLVKNKAEPAFFFIFRWSNFLF